MISVDTHLPDGSVVQLHPSAKDAFCVFEDLCLLASSEKAKFLKLQALPKTFGLELIESVLTNYHALFRDVGILSSAPSLYAENVYRDLSSCYFYGIISAQCYSDRCQKSHYSLSRYEALA